MGSKIVFFDRDGVINKEIDRYIEKVEEFEILPGIGEALSTLKQRGYKLVLVTNQGGIAKGLYGHEEVRTMHAMLQNYLSDFDAQLDLLYYSPHHPDYGNSLNRKPGSMMVERGLARLDGDPSQCVIIGDKVRDMDAGAAAGVRGILIEPNTDIRTILNQIP
ncbi:MAG: HAD-IIIA family hydrolase [Bacteroidetes bacterium]|nr:MAG: HAD-IIIA family hydrolase [Bacteroidota bacterium]